MKIDLTYGTENLDWPTVCEVIRLAPLGIRDPEKLKFASEKSFVVCSAFAGDTLVGFGRALSDGYYQSAIYDVVVLPNIKKKASEK